MRSYPPAPQQGRITTQIAQRMIATRPQTSGRGSGSVEGGLDPNENLNDLPNKSLARRNIGAASAAELQSAVDGLQTQINGISSSEYEFVQTEPSALWTIRHGLGRFPAVTTVDTAGDIFQAAVRYEDKDTITVSIGFPQAGRAFLSAGPSAPRSV